MSPDHYRESRLSQIVAAIDRGIDGSVPYWIHSRPVVLIVVTRSRGPTTAVQRGVICVFGLSLRSTIRLNDAPPLLLIGPSVAVNTNAGVLMSED